MWDCAYESFERQAITAVQGAEHVLQGQPPRAQANTL